MGHRGSPRAGRHAEPYHPRIPHNFFITSRWNLSQSRPRLRIHPRGGCPIPQTGKLYSTFTVSPYSPVIVRSFTFRPLLTAALVFLASSGYGMSVVPPSFDELVSSADVVVRGVVTDVHCTTFDTPQGEAIQTVVTLRVERTLKGSAGPEVTVKLLGGKVGARTLTILGMPTFRVGERQIVFLSNNGRAICPLVAAGHGRYHVQHDPESRRDVVLRDNRSPLASTSEVADPIEEHSGAAARSQVPLTVDDFEGRIVESVRRHAQRSHR